MERLLDDLIRDVRTIEIAGIYVVHSSGDGLAQNSDRSRNIAWRSPDELVAIAAGKLHRAIAHAIQLQ